MREPNWIKKAGMTLQQAIKKVEELETKGLMQIEIAKKLGINRGSVSYFNRNFRKGKYKKRGAEETSWWINGELLSTREKVIELYVNQNLSAQKVSEHFGTNKRMIDRFVQKNGIRKKTKPVEETTASTIRSDRPLNKYELEELAENRYFSMHIVGTNAKALDRLKDAV
jgi:transposase